MSADHDGEPSPPRPGGWRDSGRLHDLRRRIGVLAARRSVRWLGQGMLALAIVLGVRAYQGAGTAAGRAPPLIGRDLDQREVSLGAHRGEPVLVHFWATWCGVCRAEESTIVSLSHDLPVVTIASRSGGAEEIRAYLQRRQIALPVVPDPTGTIARRYGVSRFPTTFVVDADGDIRHTEVGYTTEIGLRLRMWLARD